MSIILGIDPGTTTVGYAVVERVGNLITALDYGVISTTPKAPLAEKLVEISNDLSELLSQYQIDACGTETLLFTTNRKTGISVAQARGAIISQIARKGIPLFEFGPMQVKKGIC
jgi:crossover junction endodeoxyribonuclease RuvC